MVALPATVSRRRLELGWWRFVDSILIGAVLAISILGLVMIYTSTKARLADQDIDTLYYVKRQGIAIAIGLLVMVAVMSVDYRKLRDLFASAYVIAVLLLVAVLSPLGSRSKGTQGWFELPGGFQFQPSEFAKFFLIVALGGYLYAHRDELDAWRLAITIGVVGMPIGLVLLQPDLGTAMVLGVIVFAMLAVAGARGKHLLIMVLLGISAVIGFAQAGFVKQYQLDRLTSFVTQASNTQDATYNLDQSKTAIGNGGLFGRGLGEGSQTSLSFVPEQHTDFIFTAVAEELGFIGAATLLALLGILVWRVYRTATEAGDMFGQLVCFGVLTLLAFQIFENIGMTMGIMPVTGIPLPFMSYGGSSTIALFACVGLVASVSMRR